MENKILFVSRTVPPIKSGSAFIVEQLYKYFNKDQMIFLGESSKLLSDNNERIHYINTKLFDLKRGNRFFWWLRWFFIIRIKRKIISLIDYEQCKSIICVYPDDIFLISSMLAAKELNIPFYPYFHNTYYENKKGVFRFVSKKIQDYIINNSNWVFLISEGLKEYYQKQYPDVKFKVLLHSFNMAKATKYEGLPLNRDKIIITFLGSLNDSNIDSFNFAVNVLRKRNDIVLTVISSMPKRYFEKIMLPCDNFIIKSNVSEDQLMGELRKSHFLLLPHGFNGKLNAIEYQTIFPTRTIQYLFSGVPILAILPCGCYLHRVLYNGNCAFCVVQESEDDLLKIIDSNMNKKDAIDLVVNNAINISDQFLTTNVLYVFKKIMGL